MSTQAPVIVGYLKTDDFTPIGSPYGVNQQPAAGTMAAPLATFLSSAPDNLLPGVKKSVAVLVNFTDIQADSSVLLGPLFPKFSRVIRSYYEVLTTFKSATDAAKIGIGFATDDVDGIVANTAISVGTTWDATGAAVDGVQTGAATAFGERLTADRQLQFTRGGGEVLTAGKMVVYVDYIESVAA